MINDYANAFFKKKTIFSSLVQWLVLEEVLPHYFLQIICYLTLFARCPSSYFSEVPFLKSDDGWNVCLCDLLVMFCFCFQASQLTKKEIEDLLKKGAYGALMEDDNAGDAFCEEDIDQILQRRTKTIQIESEGKGSTFAKVVNLWTASHILSSWQFHLSVWHFYFIWCNVLQWKTRIKRYCVFFVVVAVLQVDWCGDSSKSPKN